MFKILAELLETLSLKAEGPQLDDLLNHPSFKDIKEMSQILADDLIKKFEGDIASYKRNPQKFDSLFVLTMESAKLKAALKEKNIPESKIIDATTKLAAFAKRVFGVKAPADKAISGVWAGQVSQRTREQIEEQIDQLCEEILKS